MFGWEFPPFMSGGLGTACYGLTKGLTNKNVEVTFVIPHGPEDMKAEFVKLLIASNLSRYNLKIKRIDSILKPYISDSQYQKEYERILASAKKSGDSSKILYGKNIYEEVFRFSQAARLIALSDHYDIIHCHDWMTFPAGMEAKKVSGKPLIVHVHATEYDRTGGNSINDYVYGIERQ